MLEARPLAAPHGVVLTMLEPSRYLVFVANERPLINIDATLWLNLALWLALFFVLRGLLWEPMLALFAAREERVSGARHKAEELLKEARELQAEYESGLAEAKKTAAAERDRLRAEGQKREAELLAAARARMTTHVDAQRAELQAQREAVRTEMQAVIPSLVKDLVMKVLGREVRS